MPTSTAAFIVSCEGPPLDYTARVNLHAADVTVLDDGAGSGEPRFDMAPRAIRMQVESTSDREALARIRLVLASRPYVDFWVAGGVRDS